MNRRTLVIIALVVLAVLAGIVITINLMRPAPPPAEVVRTEAPKPVPPPKPKPEPPKPAPQPERRVARAAPAPKPEPEPAPPPVEAAPEAGILHIDSDVPGAQVFLDRAFLGATPVTAENVKPGTHRLNLSVQGTRGSSGRLRWRPGLTTS